MYEYIFYYWYRLLQKTPSGKDLFGSAAFAWLSQLSLIFLISILIKRQSNFDILSFLPSFNNEPYLIRKWKIAPYLAVYLGIFIFYCYKRLPKLEARFHDIEDKKILSLRNSAFALFMTFAPYVGIIWLLGGFD